MELCRLRTWSCSKATSRCSSMISLLAPNAKGERAKNTIATRDKLISDSCSPRDASETPRGSISSLLSGRQMRAAVLLPAILGRLGALRPLLAVANGFQAIGRDAQLHQEILGRRRAPVAQRQVILRRSPLVAMAFHHHREVRVLLEDLLQQRGVMRQRVAPVGANFAHVEVEESIL